MESAPPETPTSTRSCGVSMPVPGDRFADFADEGDHWPIIAWRECRRTDSNRRPKDYETFALTT